MAKIAINGFGRIGRLAFRRILDSHKNLEVVAINDLGELNILAHLLKYDSVYGRYGERVEISGGDLAVNGRRIRVFSEKDPENLPWKKLGVDIVLECTGVFRDRPGSEKHRRAGAKKVIISAPAKSEDIKLYVLGVNQDKYEPDKEDIVSMASCTTNCMAPVAMVLDREFGIRKGFMTTVHSYTNDQRILDLPHKDKRRARAAGLNIIPTTTGAAKAVEKVLPGLKGKLRGIALRVPTPTVSIADLAAELEKQTDAEEVNDVLRKASRGGGLEGILAVEDELLVSSDYIGNSYSSIIDSSLTRAFGNFIKVFSWYDNEFGYSCRLADFADFVAKRL